VLFFTLEQGLSANSLCARAGKSGDGHRQFFGGDREFSNPAANPSQPPSRAMIQPKRLLSSLSCLALQPHQQIDVRPFVPDRFRGRRVPVMEATGQLSSQKR
jgi:hypothetical protein